MTDSAATRSGPTIFFWSVFAVGVLVMAWIPQVDYAWTVYLSEHRWQRTCQFLADTMFEGEPMGGSDPAICLAIVAIGGYFAAWFRPSLAVFRRLRPQLGFFLCWGLYGAIYVVHTIKWFGGRARPGYVVRKGWEYTEWYELGPHFVTQGIYRASFPSGHTAAVLLFMTIAYCLAGDRSNPLRRRLWGWAVGMLALAYALFMSVGRAMSLSHWISDGIGVTFIGILTMHAMYYWIARVPDQEAFHRIHGRHPDSPRAWELQFCFFGFLATLGLLATLLGARSVWRNDGPWLVAMALPGVAALLTFGRRTLRVRRDALAGFMPEG